MAELKPCPFCGGEVMISLCGAYGRNYWTVTRGTGKNACTCRVFMESDAFKGENRSDSCKEELIAKWNRRDGDDDDNDSDKPKTLIAHDGVRWVKERECEIVGTSSIDRDWNLMCYDLTCCHQVLDFVKPRYCVRCGAKVVR